MTTNHHTAIANGAALDHTTFNNPNSEIDSAITDTLDATQEFTSLLVGSGSVDPAAIMELDSSDDGFLSPRMTTTQRNNITSPATGLVIYNTTTNQYEFYNSSSWASIGAGASPTTSGARAYGTTQSIANNTLDTAELPTGERFDTDDYHSLTVNDSRITIPSGKAGIYLITGCIEFATPAAAMNTYLSLRRNISEIASQSNQIVSGALHSVRLSVTTLYELEVGDYIEMVLAQNSGSALNLNGSNKYSPELTAVLLS